MYVYGPITKTRASNWHVLVIRYWFSKVTRVLHLVHTKYESVTQTFIYHWVIPHGIPKTILSDNGPKFVPKFFAAVCSIMGVNKRTKKAYNH